MKTKFAAAALVAVMVAGAANAAPYCAEMNSRDTLPKKFQKRGPFYSDAASGWIIGDDQMRGSFKVSAEARALWAAIKAEFDAQGVTLTVMAAPPRPLFAPADVRAAMGKADYDADAAAKAFSSYIEGLNQAGIAAPNLLPAAIKAERPYYFQRDTHWTPFGAALSARALADVIGMTADIAAPAFSGTYEEKGSLSMVAEAACGARPAPETAAAPDFARAGDADALLGDAAGPTLALVGTSFSDRYQRDAYRVADAIAHYTGASVENFSVSGGGVTAGMEAFIRSGRMAKFKTVVWEAPYTEPLTNISALRQILGALISQRSNGAAAEQAVEVSGDWTSITPEIALSEGGALELRIAGVATGQLDVEFYDADNTKTRVKLRKSDRVDAAMRSDVWTIALGSIDAGAVIRIKLRLKGALKGTAATLRAL